MLVITNIFGRSSEQEWPLFLNIEDLVNGTIALNKWLGYC